MKRFRKLSNLFSASPFELFWQRHNFHRNRGKIRTARSFQSANKDDFSAKRNDSDWKVRQLSEESSAAFQRKFGSYPWIVRHFPRKLVNYPWIVRQNPGKLRDFPRIVGENPGKLSDYLWKVEQNPGKPVNFPWKVRRFPWIVAQLSCQNDR